MKYYPFTQQLAETWVQEEESSNEAVHEKCAPSIPQSNAQIMWLQNTEPQNSHYMHDATALK